LLPLALVDPNAAQSRQVFDAAALEELATSIRAHHTPTQHGVLQAILVRPVGERYQVVDWKTGKAPSTPDDLEVKQLQLALYRLAYAKWKGIDPELIDAVFYFVADDTVIAPEELFSEKQLLELWPF
jgi:predicted RecB family nuclease